MGSIATTSSPRTGLWTAATCAGLLAVFAALSWFAVETKCATFDEPLHAASAYVSTFDSEYRIDPEDPPLWKYWAMLPHHTGELYIEHQGKGWDWAIVQPRNQSVWAGHMLYNTTGVDGTGFIERTRMMFLPLGVIAGAAMALLSYRLFGRIAAIVTTVLFSFDPTFLAHSPLVKNDVSITLVMLLFMTTVYQVGRRLTWMNALALGLLLGVGLTVKYSGVLLGPMMGLALLVRVSLPTPWIVIGQELHLRRQRLLAAIGVMIAATIMACIIVWACYRFRFDSGPGGAQLDMTPILQMVADNRFFLHEHRWPEHDESHGWENSATVRVAMLFEKHHLLPEAWIGGFLSTYSAAIVRPAFLMGKIYETGCWYYFPLAMLFKMPVATLLAMMAGVIWGMTRLYSVFSRHACLPAEAASMLAGCTKTSNTWRLACLWIPIVIYGASAMSSNLNLGIRHLLPIMPFVFILLGSCASTLHRHRPKVFTISSVVLGLALAVETIAAFPDYIPFFNLAVGGNRAGLKLLADSNLDWGQDLPAVAIWQSKHPETPLYLIYFGRVPPEVYDIKYAPDLLHPCMLGVSATTLQGIYLEPGKKQTFRPLWNVAPREVLDGTIYLYRFPADMPSPEVAEDIQRLIGGTPQTPIKTGDK